MIKRVLDFICAAMGVFFLFPLVMMLAFIVKTDSPGPVFYRGARAGLHGKVFRIFKFRTMVENAERIGGPSTALNDSRLTSTGKFLRKYKLDELPQLFNIILGDMSFVGPRPQVKRYTHLYSGKERLILRVKPGLTDYASIEFINLDTLLGDDDVDTKYFRDIEPVKNKLRIKYAENNNFLIDMKILFITIARMLHIR